MSAQDITSNTNAAPPDAALLGLAGKQRDLTAWEAAARRRLSRSTRWNGRQRNRHGAAAMAPALVADMFRRREILRQLSKAADRTLLTGNSLQEIAAKSA